LPTSQRVKQLFDLLASLFPRLSYENLKKRQELFQLVRPDQWDVRRAIQAENQKKAQPVFHEAERFARENRKPQRPYQFPQKGRIPSEFKSPISPLLLP
jgi:hypothetical protein